MGCYLSRKIPGDGVNRIFRVYHNDRAELTPGKMEVNASELILHQRGKETIRWPLRCLRRYGFDQELFSIESGRRCPTGPGIYAFKCRRAEELFNLVQEAIQMVGQEGHIRTSQALANGGGRHASRPTSVLDPGEHNGNGFLVSANGHVNVPPSTSEHLYINRSIVEDTQPNYVNTGGSERRGNSSVVDQHAALIDFLHEPPISAAQQATEAETAVNYADLDLPRSVENLFEQAEGACAMDTVGRREYVTPDLDPDEGFPSADIDDIGLYSADMDVFTDNPTEVTHQPTYINVGGAKTVSENADDEDEDGVDDGLPPVVRRRHQNCDRNYANLSAAAFNGDLAPAPPPPPPSLGQATSSAQAAPSMVAPVPNVNRQSDPGGLIYIEIESKKSNGTSSSNGNGACFVTPMTSTPDSPSKTESYAKIDFPRTQALLNARPGTDDGEGSRKTRHNSTINEKDSKYKG